MPTSGPVKANLPGRANGSPAAMTAIEHSPSATAKDLGCGPGASTLACAAHRWAHERGWVVAPRSEAARALPGRGRSTWGVDRTTQAPLELEVQVPLTQRAGGKALLTPLEPSLADAAAGRRPRCQLQFKEEQFSITPGQRAVSTTGAGAAGRWAIQRKPATAASHQVGIAGRWRHRQGNRLESC